MKIFQGLKNLAIVGFLVALTGCGGGGGGGGSEGGGGESDPPPVLVQEYRVPIANSTTTGVVFSADLSGNDSVGGQSTGSVSISNGAQIMMDGVLVTPQFTRIGFLYQGRTVVSTSTTYIDSSGYIVSRKEQNGRICVPAFPYRLPEFVKIGDSGSEPTQACSDNTKSDSSWKVEDAGNANANFITSKVVTDSAGAFVTSVDRTLTIDFDGNILAIILVLSASNTPSITLRNP